MKTALTIIAALALMTFAVLGLSRPAPHGHCDYNVSALPKEGEPG